MRAKREVNRLEEVKFVGDFATVACLIMYVSYIGQIIANLNGNPVSPMQPLFASLNAALWVGYGWLKPHKDWRVIIANFPGIIFGILTALTVIM
ncbi:SemiSWEET family transporter [Lentilactobacillus kisonensis]|nr:SemiSWEET family transporter [Lentilactobacillus kisonensis]